MNLSAASWPRPAAPESCGCKPGRRGFLTGLLAGDKWLGHKDYALVMNELAEPSRLRRPTRLARILCR